ncbi:MAG: hypothetical protein L6437_13595 [Kiritimatiellae bacterium]|nr:hypothetical protein [Kiritimatiellia bacterium]
MERVNNNAGQHHFEVWPRAQQEDNYHREQPENPDQGGLLHMDNNSNALSQQPVHEFKYGHEKSKAYENQKDIGPIHKISFQLFIFFDLL